MKQLKWFTNKWQIEQRDVKSIVLLRDGEEHRITNDDVGMLYVVDIKGDYLEEPPFEEENDKEDSVGD